jgi:hypothetical protein
MPKPELEFHVPPGSTGADWRIPAGDTTGALEELILAEDAETGDHTRLLRFAPGADTTANGVVTHDVWEEVWIVSGTIHDLSLGETFSAGMYACRPPGMKHGPWTSPDGAMTFEIRYRR